MNPHNPQDPTDDDLASLSDPLFIDQIVNSDPFIDWNVDLAINGLNLSREEGARIFLQLHPHYTVEPRTIHTPTRLPTLSPNLSDLWQSFENSDWHRNNEHEPKVGGHSVLRQMLVQQPNPTDIQSTWICGVPNPSQPMPDSICGQTFRRWDRAITHIRGKHLNHRPYPCHGGCGMPTWYAVPPVPLSPLS